MNTIHFAFKIFLKLLPIVPLVIFLYPHKAPLDIKHCSLIKLSLVVVNNIEILINGNLQIKVTCAFRIKIN